MSMFYHHPLTPSFSALFRPSGGGLTESIGGGTLKRSRARFDFLLMLLALHLYCLYCLLLVLLLASVVCFVLILPALLLVLLVLLACALFA